MTPMQKVKNEMSNLLDNVEPFGFKEVNLNKAGPRKGYTEFCGQRYPNSEEGVKSDFIRLLVEERSSVRIGFTFTYLELKEDEQKVSVSIKNTDDFWASNDYSVDDFRCKIKDLNQKILELNKKEKKGANFIELVKSDFEMVNLNDSKSLRRKKGLRIS
jgi:hypothetical protein